MATELERELPGVREQIERELHRLLLPPRCDLPEPLQEALQYAVFPGGKRLRPVLAILACRALRGADALVLPAAVALELIHCYSLVHDDLPAMDDDQLRRGRPTCHVVFGPALAILAGDALLTRAFEVLGEESRPELVGPFCREIAAAAGARGMVGGQAADVLGEGAVAEPSRVLWIHRHKTAALIQASLRVGGLAAGAGEDALERLDRYGLHLGLAFQVVDDLLGRIGSEVHTGKPVGKDDERRKLTYPAAVGDQAARQEVLRLTRDAVDAVAGLPAPRMLQALATELRERVA